MTTDHLITLSRNDASALLAETSTLERRVAESPETYSDVADAVNEIGRIVGIIGSQALLQVGNWRYGQS